MANPKRVAMVQQALKREMSNLFVTDKASPLTPTLACEPSDERGRRAGVGRRSTLDFLTALHTRRPHTPPRCSRCRTERVVTAATAAPFLRQVVRKALYPREARGADFALSLLASVTDLQVRDQREHAHTPQCLSVLPGSRRVRGGRNEWWLRRQLSNDLQVAKVYVSVLADQERKEATVEALCKLSGYVPLAASSHSHPQLGVTTRAACVGAVCDFVANAIRVWERDTENGA